MLIEYYQSEEYKSIRYENSINKIFHSIVDNVVWEIKDELSELLLGCIENKNLSDDLPEFILKENRKALNIHLAIPQVVITLCLYYWREHEIEDYPQNGYYNRDRDCFGMDENGVAFKYFPAGADQTPMGALLIADEQKAIDFVIQLMNESVDIYSRSRDKDYLQRVEIISDEGTVNWQWNSATLWGMFRGMGSPVSPYSIQSVHMALEKYLLNLSKEEKYEQCEKILRRLLFECHSSSVSAVATSLVLAYPFQYWKIAMILFRTVSFFRMDLSRATSESQMEGFYKMSGQTLNKDVTEERLKTCKEAFRKSHLENVCLQHQFYDIPTLTDKENDERRRKIFDILDEHRKLLNQVKGKERDYLEIMLSRMDRRKLKVTTTKKVEGGMEVHFETKLNKSAKQLSESAIVDQQEIFKYLGLCNWAIAKMKGEDAPNCTYNDDVCKVIHDAKALESEITLGRSQGLMDKQTLPWVVSCLIKFYKEQLSAENLIWCTKIIEKKFRGFNGVSDVLDSIYACIHVIPCLIELLPEYKDKYESLILQCLLVPDYNNTSASGYMTSSVNQYNLWEKEPEMMMRILHQFIDRTKMMGGDKYSIWKMKVIFGLVPKCPNEEATLIIDDYLKSIPSLLAKGHEVIHHFFDVIDTLADLFMRTESKQILADLSYTNDIVMSNYIGNSYLTSIIVKADSYRNPDRFWEIWNSFRNIVPDMVNKNCNQQLRTYLLNTQWVDDVNEWHSLRPQDLEFFMYMAENARGNATVFNGLVSLLTTVGTNYKKEGMRWISTTIERYPNINLRDTPALQYLELIMMPYVYANKMQIRQNPELLVQVRTILNFMVTKSSVTGYVLRDLVN